MQDLKIDYQLFLTAIILMGFCSHPLFAQADRFEAGLAAKERGHYATALRSWLPMAEAGNAEAQNNIGHMYEEGFGVSQNYSTAMEWYRRAATGGLAEAEHNIGLLYNNGYGVAENAIEAVRWFKLAAKKELRESEYMLGLAYQSGNGSSLDYAEARRLFLSSAKKNYAAAQMMYAYMLQAGEGDRSNSLLAYIWGKIAEKNGLEAAIDVTSIASIQLEAEEIIDAENTIAECIKTAFVVCPEG
jgi:TPR repeat protein